MIDYKFTAEDYSIFVALLENSHEFKIRVKMTERQRQYSCAKRTFLNLPFILLLWNWSPFISQFDINAFIIEFTNSSSYFGLLSDTFVAKECYAETQALCVLSKGRRSL
jgi:hypothetical protein